MGNRGSIGQRVVCEKGAWALLGWALVRILGCTAPDPTIDDAGEQNAGNRSVAGFVSLAPRPISFDGFGISEEGVTTAAKIFYTYRPARVNSSRKPTFVFLNGGPGAATSSALAAWGTGPWTMTADGVATQNTADFSTIGNLVYIDTRQAGFSFDEIDDPSNAAAREESFNFINFNIYTDAADILLTLVSIFRDHPDISKNPVVTVAESYGGARAAVLFSLASAAFKESVVYTDSVLFARLRDHFEAIAPDDPVGASIQFGRQVLIQPGMVLSRQVESAHTLYSLCDHLDDGDSRIPLCKAGNFDYSDIREAPGFFDELNRIAQNTILTPDGFLHFFGSAEESVPDLFPENRDRAFRRGISDEPAGMNLDGVVLQEWDAHHIAMNRESYTVWMPEAYDPGAMVADAFVESLAAAHIFITDAYYDYAVDSSEYPAALLEWSLLREEPVFADARLVRDSEDGEARPGWMEVTFVRTPDRTPPGATPGPVRRVRMPEYLLSGHMVTQYQAADFYADVRAFLLQTGLTQIDD